ncbi:Cell division control protein 42 [Mycena sanguinolenta]|uniref:Cell division control protein 42 n=1 Tax=Mycena sanguinolenta TaxID=230812 RepID=A0A8H7CR84_9AGAR|nr:Cell division control protein 42 [Mycena sanguinolenta]
MVLRRTNSPPKPRKILILGDNNVGKTSIIIAYKTAKFPAHAPHVMETCFVTTLMQEKHYPLKVFDTGVGGGDFNYDRFRPLAYPRTDVFLVCFKVTSPISLDRVRDEWVPEIRHYCSGVPFLLVAAQIDLRDDSEAVTKLTSQTQRLISTEEGKRLAHELRAAKYVECSTLTQEGLNNIFEEVRGFLRSFTCADRPHEAINTTLEFPVNHSPSQSRRRTNCVIV